MLNELVHAKVTGEVLDQAAEWLRAYFRIEVEGLEHIPKTGRALIAPNHSGYAAADAVMISHLVHHDQGRVPRILAHRAFFNWFKALTRVSRAFGLEEVSVDRGIELLGHDELVLVFPEGESGSFKNSLKRYHLQRFHSGFLRMALETGAPIIPCVVVGAEESHLCLGSVDCSRLLKGLRLPLPLNVVPLPAKWKIRFLEPIRLDGYGKGAARDRRLIRELSADIQVRMQRELNHELARRKHVYFQA